MEARLAAIRSVELTMEYAAFMAILAILALGLVMFRRSEKRRAHRVLDLARDHEQAGRFASACYHLAVAAAAGASRRECHERIRALWAEHGPFDFDAEAREVVETYCRASRSCGEGYHELVKRDIARIVDSLGGRKAT